MIVQKGLEVSKNPKRKLISLPFSFFKRPTRDHLLQINHGTVSEKKL